MCSIWRNCGSLGSLVGSDPGLEEPDIGTALVWGGWPEDEIHSGRYAAILRAINIRYRQPERPIRGATYRCFAPACSVPAVRVQVNISSPDQVGWMDSRHPSPRSCCMHHAIRSYYENRFLGW